MREDPGQLASRGARLLGARLEHLRPIGGGDLSTVVEVALADGRRAIVKGGPEPATEARMLEAIRATGAPAPAVLACDGLALVIELAPTGSHLGTAWADLGRVLARLHATRGPRYGFESDYAFGPVAIENGWCESWVDFWAERRLANQASALPTDLARRVTRLAAGLSAHLPDRPAPALLHGDLWGGNVLAAGGRISALIDPACYYGDREVDFAMLELFDRPDGVLYETYGPFEPGRRRRLPIYQLWPALVHFRLFGSSYRPLVERLLATVGA